MRLTEIKLKTNPVTSKILDIPLFAWVRVPNDEDGIYRVNKIKGENICVCSLSEENNYKYEWHHYSKCKLVE